MIPWFIFIFQPIVNCSVVVVVCFFSPHLQRNVPIHRIKTETMDVLECECTLCVLSKREFILEVPL